MKETRIYLSLGIVIMVLFSLSAFFQNKNTRSISKNNDGLIYSEGFLEWELMRLRDPETGKIPEGIRQKELAFAKNFPKASQKGSFFNWVSRGPWNVGGRTRAAALDINNENIILAGGVSGGMWRSVDGGNSWAKVTTNEQLHNVTCLVQDKRSGKNNTWYYGTGEAYGNSASESFSAFFTGNGVFKSTDNGITWESIVSTASNTPQFTNDYDLIWNIALDQSNDTADIIYLATKGKIFRTVNGGESWTSVLDGSNTTSYYTDVAVTTTGIAYATLSYEGSKKGIWRTSDGINWTNIIPGDFPKNYNRLVIGINPSDENEIYFLGVTPNYGQQITNFLNETEWCSLWKYTYLGGNGADSNGTWVNLSSNLPHSGITSFDNFYAQGSYDLVIKIKPDEPNVIFIGGTNLYRSTDGFTTPDNTMQIGGYKIHTSFPDFKIYPSHHPDQHVLFFKPSNPDILYSATDGGVFRTDNCMADTVTWNSLNKGYITSQLYTICIDENNENNIMLAGFQDNGNFFTNSNNPQDSWIMPLNGDGSYMAMSNDGNTYYLSIQQGKTFKMTLDANGQPTGFARIDPIGASGYQFINPFIIDPNNNNIMYMAAGKYIWRNDSLNYLPLAGNYDSISKGWFKMGASANYTNVNITALAVSKTPANVLYYGTTYKKVFRVDSADTGDPVHHYLTSSLTLPNGYVSSIAIDPRDAYKVLIVYSNYNIKSLFYSEDGGTNWTHVSGNFETSSTGTGAGPSCRGAAIMPYADSTYYLIAASTGFYYTTKLQADSTVWTEAGSGVVGNVVCEMIRTRLSDGTIALATHGNGAYSTKISFSDIENPSKDLLNINVYPNPASDYINIKSTVSENTNAILKIYNLSGKLMYEHTITAYNGKYSSVVQTSGYPPGTYIVSIESGKTRKVNKFIINR